MSTPDPDWWTPHTDDYATTYDETDRLAGPDDADPGDDPELPTVGEEYAEFDAGVRYSIERGRPGYTYDNEE